jgi:tripartite-type tricarboxylate transporter receptor subunit TctC/ABC-type molybdate transport system substrate-binding protein
MRLNRTAVSGPPLVSLVAALVTGGLTVACESADDSQPRIPSGEAREVRVVTSGGFSAAYDLLKDQAEETLGIRLHTERGASSGGALSSIPVRLERGERFDVIILSRSSLDRLTDERKVRPKSRVDLVRSTIGMAVKSGAPKPDIGSREAFVRTLMEAESIGYSASASGTYLSTVLWPEMGIWEQLRPKSTRILGERVAAVVARGDVQIGFQQVSEILPIEGADFVGTIPDELQKVTTFSAGILERADNREDAERLIRFLASRSAAATIESTGLEAVVLEDATPTSSPTPVVGAQDFPQHPITMVVGLGVGGSADRMARAMSRHVGEELGQPIRVINKKGAGTLLGANYVLSRPHDGYTVFASTFSPYLINTILEGNAEYGIEDFAYLNFQWFDEDLIALSKDSRFTDLPGLLQAIRSRPKTVKASVVRGSAGHLMTKLLLEVNGIPQENLNLVAYNSGGMARAAVAGGVVDFIIISAEGSESIREYLRPLAIVSDRPNPAWNVPTINEALRPLGVEAPVLPGSMRGFAVSAQLKRDYPKRFELIAAAFRLALENEELQAMLDEANIGGRWIGPERAAEAMRSSFEVFKNYSYLLQR